MPVRQRGSTGGALCTRLLVLVVMVQTAAMYLMWARHLGSVEWETSHAIDSGPAAARAALSKPKLEFVAEHEHGFQVLVHSHFAPNSPGPNDVTWVTQFTTDRLDILKHLLTRWEGPICAAVWTSNIDWDYKVMSSVFDRVDVHFIGAAQSAYPVNLLRNVALNHARTEYVLLADVDFVPNVDMYKQLTQFVPKLRDTPKMISVFPAFELNTTKDTVCENTVMPKTKAELLEKVGDRCIHPVHDDPGRAVAHSPTGYATWYTATSPFSIDYAFPFEPYYVARKEGLPRYDARFIVYGNDKAVQTQELSLAGFSFQTLDFGFVMHTDHGPGAWLFLRCPKDILESVMSVFWQDLDRKYKQTVSPLPPLPSWVEGFTEMPGQRGHSCDDACDLEGLVCHESLFSQVNHCDVLQKHYHCFAGCHESFGNDLPNFESPIEKCLVNMNKPEWPSLCMAKHRDTRRMCPCAKPRKA